LIVLGWVCLPRSKRSYLTGVANSQLSLRWFYNDNLLKVEKKRLLNKSVPKLNTINEKLLLLDIAGIIDSGRHFQHKKCPKIEGKMV
jgi:hypothetical protein